MIATASDRIRLMMMISAMAVAVSNVSVAAGSSKQADPGASAYRQLTGEVESNLKREILSQWFPRSVDVTNGGFQENFDERWQPREPKLQRSIVYQSRLTWSAAAASKKYPEMAGTYREYAQHGLDFLREKMWDGEQGGFFWQIDAQTGKPTPDRGGEKHVYGISFGIYAAAAGYEATHDAKVLDLAKRGFQWLDTHAHDTANGGYYEALTRDGKPILESPASNRSDAIGTVYGRKSMNTHIHLLEAFTELHKVWPDPAVRRRLDEVFHIIRDKVYSEPGFLNLFFAPDWKPVPGSDSFGHDIEAAYLLVEASTALGKPNDRKTWSASRNLVDHALKVGWDEGNGGFYDHGPVAGPADGMDKVWWTEAEGLNALLLMHEKYGKETPRYWKAFVKQWEFISKRQVDRQNRGWLSSVTREGSLIPNQPKSDQWKDPYHQGRALLNVSAALSKLARRTSGR